MKNHAGATSCLAGNSSVFEIQMLIDRNHSQHIRIIKKDTHIFLINQLIYSKRNICVGKIITLHQVRGQSN